MVIQKPFLEWAKIMIEDMENGEGKKRFFMKPAIVFLFIVPCVALLCSWSCMGEGREWANGNRQ
jgi:hypothetical protein